MSERKSKQMIERDRRKNHEDSLRYLHHVEEMVDQLIDMVERTIEIDPSRYAMRTDYGARREMYAGVTEEMEPYFVGQPVPMTVAKNIIDECQSFLSAVAKLQKENA